MKILKILLRLSLLVFVSTCVVTAGTAWYAWQLPNIYESYARLIVFGVSEDSESTQKVAKDRADKTLTSLLSNGKLLGDLIYKKDLFAEEKANGATFPMLLERIEKGLKVEVSPANSNYSIQLTYRDQNPKTTQKVTFALAEGFTEVYDSLPNNEAQTNATQNNERISVAREQGLVIIDPPMMPLSPVAPKRGIYVLLGIVGGAILGLLFGGLYEWRRWKKPTINFP